MIVPGPLIIDYPTFLGRDSIELLAYPVETFIAQKIRAVVAPADANSRMMDFYDVWICSAHLEFKADSLFRAIRATFKNRECAIPDDEFEVLNPEFATRHLVQWNALVKRIGEGGTGRPVCDRHQRSCGLRSSAAALS